MLLKSKYFVKANKCNYTDVCKARPLMFALVYQLIRCLHQFSYKTKCLLWLNSMFSHTMFDLILYFYLVYLSYFCDSGTIVMDRSYNCDNLFLSILFNDNIYTLKWKLKWLYIRARLSRGQRLRFSRASPQCQNFFSFLSQYFFSVRIFFSRFFFDTKKILIAFFLP